MSEEDRGKVEWNAREILKRIDDKIWRLASIRYPQYFCTCGHFKSVHKDLTGECDSSEPIGELRMGRPAGSKRCLCLKFTQAKAILFLLEERRQSKTEK